MSCATWAPPVGSSAASSPCTTARSPGPPNKSPRRTRWRWRPTTTSSTCRRTTAGAAARRLRRTCASPAARTPSRPFRRACSRRKEPMERTQQRPFLQAAETARIRSSSSNTSAAGTARPRHHPVVASRGATGAGCATAASGARGMVLRGAVQRALPVRGAARAAGHALATRRNTRPRHAAGRRHAALPPEERGIPGRARRPGAGGSAGSTSCIGASTSTNSNGTSTSTSSGGGGDGGNEKKEGLAGFLQCPTLARLPPGVAFADDGSLVGRLQFDPRRPSAYDVAFVAVSTARWDDPTFGIARLEVSFTVEGNEPPPPPPPPPPGEEKGIPRAMCSMATPSAASSSTREPRPGSRCGGSRAPGTAGSRTDPTPTAIPGKR